MSKHGNLFSYRAQKGSENTLHIILSKKIIKKAVDRNLLKRRIKNSIKNIKIEPGIIFLYVKKEAVGKKYSEIKEDLENLFNNKT